MAIPEVLIICIVSAIIILAVVAFDDNPDEEYMEPKVDRKVKRKMDELTADQIKEYLENSANSNKCSKCLLYKYCEHEKWDSCMQAFWNFMTRGIK